MNVTNIVIVGGGMTGTTLALAISYLTNGQLPVHIIESVAPKSVNHLNSDSRTIALSQGTCQHFVRIGIWQTIADYATPIKSVHVSDRGHVGFVTINAHDYYIDALGQVIELKKAIFSLFSLLYKAPGITLHCPAQVTQIIRNTSTVSVILDKDKMLEAQLLVMADGSCSKLASHCGIKYLRQPYSQVAIIANVSTSAKHKGRAWERFTDRGPIAMLPTMYDNYSLIWCHPLYDKNTVLSWSDEYFCNKLQKSFGWRLGRIKNVNKRIAYPLSLTVATRFITHRMVLVGNAAQTLHPVAGQGFNLGLRDVISLAKILAQEWSKKQDCGAYYVLNCYKQQRYLDKISTIDVTDSLVTLFTSRWKLFVTGRNIGLIAMELFIPARDILAQRAMGWII